jgi:hypothetical protein
MRAQELMLAALVGLMPLALILPSEALAGRWEVRKEVREGARAVHREKREAAREIRRCKTRECARREIHEGYREVGKERREARREIRREVREDYYDNFYRGRGRWYRDGRDWDRYDYERRYYRRDRYRDRDDDDFLKGAAVGAVIVGVAAAVANSGD